MNPLEIETAVAALKSTGNFRITRRLDIHHDPRLVAPRKGDDNLRIGLCLDTETTGLDYREHTVIELGIVAFTYHPETGAIGRIVGSYSGFEDPGYPLSAEVISVTGITDDLLQGTRFDDAAVAALAEQADLVIAHNAGFDRRFIEKRFPVFATLPWACTLTQIDWLAEKISTRTLEYLLYKCGGWFIDAHRALNDAEGLSGLLLEQLPVSGGSIFKALLDNAFRITSRIAAVGSPFDKKDLLKQRGYRWHDGANGTSKSWWTSVPQDDEQEEVNYLAEEIYPYRSTSSVVINRIDAYSRFSERDA